MADARTGDAVTADAVAPDRRDDGPTSVGTQIVWSVFSAGIPVYPEAWHSGPLGARTVAIHDGFVDAIEPVAACGGRRHVFRSTMSADELARLESLRHELASHPSVSASCGCLGDCAFEQVQIVTGAASVLISGSPSLRGARECEDSEIASLIPSAAVDLADILRQTSGLAGAEVVPQKIRIGRIVPPDGVFPAFAPTEWPFPDIDLFVDVSDRENRPYVIADPVLAQRIWEFFDLAEATWPSGHECERGLFSRVSAAGRVADVAASPLLDWQLL